VSAMNPMHWIKYFMAVTTIAILSISLTNYLVNPYRIFTSSPLNSLLLTKQHLLSSRMTQVYNFKRIQPSTLMMGTSRIGLFSPKQLEVYLDKPIQNLALEGSSIYEQYCYLRYAIEHGRIKNIIWGLDFFAFNPDKSPDGTFESERLESSFYWSDYATALFNFKTFQHSLATIKDKVSAPETIDFSGQPFTPEEIKSNITYTLNEYRTHKKFLASNSFQQSNSIDQNLGYVQTIINLCRKHDIRCELYTSPVYEAHLKMYNAMGLEKTFRYWKISLSRKTSYVDFCTVNSVTQNLLYFRDSSHVIQEVGSMIFARLFHDTTVKKTDDFGIDIFKNDLKSTFN